MKILLLSVLTTFCLLGLALLTQANGYGQSYGHGGGYGYGGGFGYLPYYGGYYGNQGGGGFGNGGFLALIGLIFIIIILFGTGFNRTTSNQTISVIQG